VSLLVPCLFLFNLLVFPDLVLATFPTIMGASTYGLGFVLFCSGVWLFALLQGRSFGFLLVADEGWSERSSGSAFALLRQLGSGDDGLQVKTLAFGFWSAMEIAIMSGRNLRDALGAASHLFPSSELAHQALLVLRQESKGEQIVDAFGVLRSSALSDAREQLLQLARVARERTMLLEATTVLANRSRESLAECAEERLGGVGVQLLLPLCLGLLPAAVLVLLAPILLLVQEALG
jgi:hypothetical protein